MQPGEQNDEAKGYGGGGGGGVVLVGDQWMGVRGQFG